MLFKYYYNYWLQTKFLNFPKFSIFCNFSNQLGEAKNLHFSLHFGWYLVHLKLQDALNFLNKNPLDISRPWKSNHQIRSSKVSKGAEGWGARSFHIHVVRAVNRQPDFRPETSVNRMFLFTSNKNAVFDVFELLETI